MNKSSVKLVILTVILALVVNIIFGRFLTAKISTLPVLNRWKILSPQAPIVINTTKEERISDTGDTIDALNTAKSKLSLLVSNKDNQVAILGGAVNVTSDGLFLVSKLALPADTQNLFIKADGQNAIAVDKIILDPATNLALVQTQARNIPVAAFGVSENLPPAQKVILAINSLTDYAPHFLQGFVTVSQKDIYGKLFDANFPSRSFGIQNASELLPGHALVNVDGEIVGIWDGKEIISSDVIKNTLTIYFANQAIIRPDFGFRYRQLTEAESKILGITQGAVIKKVSPTEPAVAIGSPAQKAGLQENDIIQTVGDTQVSDTNSLEVLLQNFKPGDQVKLKVLRGTSLVTVMLTVGQLK